MRFRNSIMAAGTVFMMFVGAEAFAAANVGEAAPVFSAVDAAGRDFSLKDHQGKIVVLEWTNHECPFVKKHYKTGNMQRVQKEAKAMENVEWVSIVSSAPGRQGHVASDEALNIARDSGAQISYKILDENGEIGKLYGALTTPHMYIIDAEGQLVYAGAIDNKSSPHPDTVKTAENYVLAALNELQDGKPVSQAQTRPYGCSVKY